MEGKQRNYVLNKTDHEPWLMVRCGQVLDDSTMHGPPNNLRVLTGARYLAPSGRGYQLSKGTPTPCL